MFSAAVLEAVGPGDILPGGGAESGEGEGSRPGWYSAALSEQRSAPGMDSS